MPKWSSDNEREVGLSSVYNALLHELLYCFNSYPSRARKLSVLSGSRLTLVLIGLDVA